MTEETAKPTRKVRSIAKPPTPPPEAPAKTPVAWADGPASAPLPDPENYAVITRGVVHIDVIEAHKILMGELRSDPKTGGALIEALDLVQDRIALASRLKNRARREYELFKDVHKEWLEEKKTAARIALQEEKAAGKITKQITIDMVDDAVLAGWPDEYRKRKRELADFQAAVHTLEDLHEVWKSRARTLGDLKDLVIAYRPAAGR